MTPLEFSDRYDDWQTDWLPMLPAARQLRPILVNCAYLIKKFAIHQAITGCHIASSARRILGRNAVYNAIETMRAAMEATGRSRYYNVPGLSNCLCLALLLNGLKGKLTLQELTLAQLKEVAAKPYPYKALRPACVTISELLYELGFITEVLPPVAGAFPLKARKAKIPVPERRKDLLPPQWGELLDQWGRACVQRRQAPRTIESQRSRIAKIIRYVVATYPTRHLPHQWTLSIAKEVVKAADKMRVGMWNNPAHKRETARNGEELKPAGKAQLLNAIRCFFRDGRRKKWFTLQFDPDTDLRTPQELIDEITPNPKAIDDAIWEQVTQAALTLTPRDIRELSKGLKRSDHEASYPSELVQALACILVFGGLRRDEIWRLERGCVQLPPYHAHDSEARRNTLAHICILRVPVNKSSGEFKKPVDYRLRAAIEAWEASRPAGGRRLDKKAEKQVHFLFEWRGRSLNPAYINQFLIPLLCRKAQVDTYDTKGRIHCHRIRATLATRYYKAGLGSEELRRWLGHGNQVSLRNYLDLDDEWLLQQQGKAVRDDRYARDYPPEPDALLLNPRRPLLVDTDPGCQLVEQVKALAQKDLQPGHYLDHLFKLPKLSNQGFVLRTQESLADLLRNVDVPPDERRQLAMVGTVLTRLAARA